MIKNLTNNKKKKKGFTLIELIIVIAIIAILAAIAIPKFGEVRKKANISADVANAKQIQSAVSALIADGELQLPTGTNKFLFDGGSTEDTDDTIGAEAKVKEYLQGSIPKIKVSGEGTYFNVEIDNKGVTTIKSSAATPSVVYPRPTTGTGTYLE